jgi:hypothetical protein
MDAAVVGTPVSAPQPTQLTFEDGLGERRYAIGAVNEPLEVLKLSSVLSTVSSFDFALRERGARLTGFRHESYARVRSIELDRRTSALIVTSDYVPGVRLSTILTEAHKRSVPLEFNAVRCLLRQLVSAATALHDAAPDIANGAIAPERLVLTPSGRLMIVEYVLGAALEQLGHSRARYWRELGVALPGQTGPPSFDARADVTQIGAVALAVILGRPLAIDEFPDRLGELIQGATLRSVMGSLEPLPRRCVTGCCRRSSSINGNRLPLRPMRGRHWMTPSATRTRSPSSAPFTSFSRDTHPPTCPGATTSPLAWRR